LDDDIYNHIDIDNDNDINIDILLFARLVAAHERERCRQALLITLKCREAGEGYDRYYVTRQCAALIASLESLY
jgi:hypothetical protein